MSSIIVMVEVSHLKAAANKHVRDDVIVAAPSKLLTLMLLLLGSMFHPAGTCIAVSFVLPRMRRRGQKQPRHRDPLQKLLVKTKRQTSFMSTLAPVEKQDPATISVPSIGNDTMPASANKMVVRLATPNEIDNLSIVVANSFVPKRATDSVFLSWRNQWEWFSTRWTVYAGMLQRLLVSNYKEGLKSATGANGEANNYTLFVAEMTVGDSATRMKTRTDLNDHHSGGLLVGQTFPAGDRGNSMSADSGNSSRIVVGVAELTHGPQPFCGKQTHHPKTEHVVPVLCNLAVLPDYRNMGIGRTLVRHILDVVEGASSTTDQELWLETGYTNVPALRLYLSEGFAFVGVDPKVRGKHRNVYLKKANARKEAIPSEGNNVLRLVRNKDDNNTWTAIYDLGDDNNEESSPFIGEMSFLEKNFGVLAPLVAAVGAVIGAILF